MLKGINSAAIYKADAHTSNKSLLVKKQKPADCLNLLQSVATDWAVVNVAYMRLPEESYARSFFPYFAYVVVEH